MSPTDATSDVERDPIERLAEEFVERQRRGECPSLSEYASRYPELAEEIRDLFPALVIVEQFKPAGEDPSVSEDARLGPATASFGAAIGHLGDFRLIREVGRGGMGVVYEAVQESMGRRVALKILTRSGRLGASQIERFRLEARSAGQLHHSNIVPVHGVGEHDGVHYYAMQFIEGHGLDAILHDLRRLRGLGDVPAAAGLDDGPTHRVDGSSALRSMALARSIISGGFERTEAPAECTAALSRTTAATDPDTSIIPGPAPSAVSPSEPSGGERGREPPDGPGRRPADSTSSELSLANERRFYQSAARIGLQVAEALAYAHQHGILHRDIKPSNLLLDIAGHVWVTDFGLAKVEGSDGPTRTGDIVGTLRYMAPERFNGWSDRRSDVYSLGATLYELLTLHSVFPGAAHGELLEKVLHESPAAPRKLDPRIPRDLETIVLKAMAREPGDRYPTAQAMGEDLRRFLDDRPVLARRSTSVEQFVRWCRRNPWLAAANLTAAALTTALAIVMTVAAWTFHEQRDQIAHDRDRIQRSEANERQARIEARGQLFEARKAQARATRLSKRPGQRFDSLDALGKAADIARELKMPPESFARLRDEAIACLALPDLKPTGRVITSPPGFYPPPAFDPTLTRYAMRFKDGTILVRRYADDQEIARFHARGDREFELYFSPDGRYLATTHFPDYALTVWDIDRRADVLNDPGPERWGTTFSPDSRRFALVHGDGELLVYDLVTGRPGRRWRGPARPRSLAFRPDGARIAILSASPRPACRIFEAETGRLVLSISLPAIPEASVAWSPDGTTLAIPCDDRRLYLWDAATGIRKSTLEGHTNHGLRVGFHPAGMLMVSNGWEGRLWLWDPVLGRRWLNLEGRDCNHGWNFPGRDGRVVLGQEDRWITYQIDPALEYRTMAHPTDRPIEYYAVAIRHDGRILAVGSYPGVVLWDLARGTELAFLPIAEVGHLTFEASGDLLTNGAADVLRWPVRLAPGRNEFRIGPPDRLPLRGAYDTIAEDRSGRIVAVTNYAECFVLTPQGVRRVGPLDDCRFVSISPDGQWLATGSFGKNGFQVWRIRDTRLVAHPVTEGFGIVRFSPDGRWLMNGQPPCRLWEVGTWREARRIGGYGLDFSPDGRLLAVQDPSKVIRLLETETGRTLATFENPDLCTVSRAAFSPDSSRLVVTTRDGPAVHVWDLRAIRRRLAEMGLDWDAPAYPDDDPADPSLPPLPPISVDLGPLTGHIEEFTESAPSRLERYSARLQKDPNDADAYHHRAHARADLRRFEGAIADLTEAIRLRSGDAHLHEFRGTLHRYLFQYEAAIADLEAALRFKPDQPTVWDLLAVCYNNRAWELANGADPSRHIERAQDLIERAVRMAPGRQMSLNTMGVVQYRAGRYAEAMATLERSLAAGQGPYDAFDLFFLAMAHQRLGHRDRARESYDRAVRWLRGAHHLNAHDSRELAGFQKEATILLTDLPDDVFAGPR